MLFCHILHIWQVDLNNRVFDTMAAILTIAMSFCYDRVGLLLTSVHPKKVIICQKKNFKKKAAKIFISFNELPFFF